MTSIALSALYLYWTFKLPGVVSATLAYVLGRIAANLFLI